jgi:hypothetical protein
MNRPPEESEAERVWRLLAEAGFVDITIDEFPERIKEAKNAVMGRLGELLERANDIQERRSAAHSLATLREIETTLGKSAKQRAK